MSKPNIVDRASDHAVVSASSPVNVIVAGLARSGLTATCQMLAAGGMKVAGDYPAFEPYPMGGVPWGQINGQVVKLVDSQRHLPPSGTYAVIRLKRDMKEQAKSFAKFLGQFVDAKPNTKRIIRSFVRDYRIIDDWAKEQRSLITVEFERIIEQPKVVASELGAFLGVDLDIDEAASVVIPRGTECHDEVLELRMIRSH